MAAPPTDAFARFETDITTKAAENSRTSGNAISRGPSPNRGASVPDNVAVGSDSMTQLDWLKQHNIDKSKRINLVKVSHMQYQHEDLNQITVFLRGEHDAETPSR